MFIDHGHFQYNSVALGFLIFSTGFLIRGNSLLSAVCFTLSFLFKQTFLYFAPLFFAIMLGEALKLPTYPESARRVILLGLVVLATVTTVLCPISMHCGSVECTGFQLASLLRRVFPFHRRIFEDYVANVWVALSPMFRLRYASDSTLQLARYASLCFTICGFFECCWVVVRYPSKQVVAVSLGATSMSFYLFSWMVHEKAILLPLTAVLCGIPTISRTGHFWTIPRLFEAALISLWHLVRVEQSEAGVLGIAGFAMVLVYVVQSSLLAANSRKYCLNSVCIAANVCAFSGAVLQAFAPSPARFPHIWVLWTCLGCLATFLIIWRQLVCIVSQCCIHDFGKLKQL